MPTRLCLINFETLTPKVLTSKLTLNGRGIAHFGTPYASPVLATPNGASCEHPSPLTNRRVGRVSDLARQLVRAKSHPPPSGGRV